MKVVSQNLCGVLAFGTVQRLFLPFKGAADKTVALQVSTNHW
jgi:hypothetical protein